VRFWRKDARVRYASAPKYPRAAARCGSRTIKQADCSSTDHRRREAAAGHSVAGPKCDADHGFGRRFVAALGWEGTMQATGKIDGRTWVRRGRFVLLTLIGVAVAAIAFSQSNGSKDEITGTLSQSEPPIKQDGTPAHPYSDANQCPARTDLIFWPSGRSVPSIPPSISVCFVGNQPFESSAPDRVEIRDR